MDRGDLQRPLFVSFVGYTSAVLFIFVTSIYNARANIVHEEAYQDDIKTASRRRQDKTRQIKVGVGTGMGPCAIVVTIVRAGASTTHAQSS